MRKSRCWVSLLFAVAMGSMGGIPVLAADDKVDFNRDIRPIFAETCWQCHGPGEQEAGVRLDVRDESLKEAESGEIPIVPGKPEQSEIIRRILSDDESEVMPPIDFDKSLTAEQKSLLSRWVEQGAEYKQHWSFAELQRPEVPTISEPTAPLRNPVDRFVLHTLAQQGITPAPEADRRTLLRRVTLDLTGLPPTPEEVDQFLNDTSDDAYEKVVTRLLNSPRYAEKQAIYWLDAVRYADTTGFHGDQHISVWPYRDYVLRSIHENKPFDQFTREQLAGDLLPNRTRDQLVASAFNRLNRMSAEGGVQDKEYRAKYAADRVRSVSLIWLGATLGCAECHDHKFDPLTSRDFYSMAAFYADVSEKGFYDRGFSSGDWGSRISLSSPDQQSRLAQLDAEILKAQQESQQTTDDQLKEDREAWIARLRGLDKVKQLKWQWQTPTSATTVHGAELTIQDDGLVVAGGPNPDREVYTVTFQPGEGEWTSLLLQTGVAEELPGNRVGRGWVSYVITELELEATENGSEPKRIAFTEVIPDGVGQSPQYPAWGAIDGDPDTGWGHEHSHSFAHKLVVRLREPLKAGKDTVVTLRLRQESEIRRATIGRFKVAVTQVPGAGVEPAGGAYSKLVNTGVLPKSVLDAVRAKPEEQTDAHRAGLTRHFRFVSRQLEPFRRRIAELNGEKTLLTGRIPTALVTQATSKMRLVRILPRGDWMDDSGPLVQPAVPAVLGELKTDGFRATRLDLANWLTSTENPLTARTFTNRIWRQFFGSGLAGILEDLGSQGEPPAYPELLDWLASEFIQPTWQPEGTHAWDWKHLVKVIVTSHTYRQSAHPRPDIDARQSAVRLDAELIRDNALSIAGLLRHRFGGRSVFPVQPDGYWSALNYPQREYASSLGDDQHRRSLYTHWQRTFVHPTMLAFDACTREESSVNRSNSNTPLQALVLLNDPIYHEAARAFGESILRHGGDSVDSQIGWAFNRAVSRQPTLSEKNILLSLYAARLTQFYEHPASAEEFLAVGDTPAPDDLSQEKLAAMTTVARTILNLHETITRN